ncbi:MAG: lipopolysaccharide biosynthesis protein [Anaerolineales bacterium]|nr:lipopolysaccharide biosynthesis protein [Anaerolineales bacterium]
MFLIEKAKTFLQNDPLIRRVLRNSGYLFSSSTISSALGLLQGILVIRLLGDSSFGLLAVIMDFPSNVNRLLSFRMSEVTVKYMGEALAQNDKQRASALVKGIGLTEAATSVLAYLVLLLLSVLGAQIFAKDWPADWVAYLFRFYGLFLLANIVYETSVGVLQAFDHFKKVALANFYQSIALTALIAAAFLFEWDIFGVLTAYLIGKTIAGFLIAGYAIHDLNDKLGRDWMRTSLKLVPDWKPILRFAFSTNLNGTVNLFARDNIRLYLAALLTTADVAYFALATRLINLVMTPLEPFIWPTYAEITKTIAQKQWQATRKLLKQVSTIGLIWTLLAGGGLALISWWLIPFMYGADMAPAYACFIILLIGYGVANVANWNRPLLLALGRPNFPLIVSAITGAIEVALIFILVPAGGYLVGAAVVSGYFVISIGWTALRGISIIKHEEALA